MKPSKTSRLANKENKATTNISAATDQKNRLVRHAITPSPRARMNLSSTPKIATPAPPWTPSERAAIECKVREEIRLEMAVRMKDMQLSYKHQIDAIETELLNSANSKLLGSTSDDAQLVRRASFLSNQVSSRSRHLSEANQSLLEVQKERDRVKSLIQDSLTRKHAAIKEQQDLMEQLSQLRTKVRDKRLLLQAREEQASVLSQPTSPLHSETPPAQPDKPSNDLARPPHKIKISPKMCFKKKN